MAITILPKENSIGELLGAGLGQGLQQLAQMKLQQALQQKQSSGLQALGFDPEKARQITQLDPKIQLEVIKQHLAEPKRQAQEAFLQSQGLPEGITQFQGPAQKALITQLFPQAQEANLERLLDSPEPQTQAQLGAMTTQTQPRAQVSAQSPTESLDITEKLSVPDKKTPKQMGDVQETATLKLSYKPAPLAQAQQDLAPLYKRLNSEATTPEQKVRIRSEIEKREEKYQKKQDAIDQKYAKYIDELRKRGGQAADETDLQLQKMLQNVNSGKLIGPIRAAPLEFAATGIPRLGIRLDLFGLTSTETQEFKKIQADMLRNIKDFFGARITDNEIKLFMQRVPSLLQSDEGKRVVIRDLGLLNQANRVRVQALNEILEENDGYTPNNIDQLIEKRASPALDKIAEEFKSHYVSPQQLEREYNQMQRQKVPVLGGIYNLLDDVINLF
jgi:hypothetical protein